MGSLSKGLFTYVHKNLERNKFVREYEIYTSTDEKCIMNESHKMC